MTRSNPTELEVKVARLERAIAQVASALRVCSGWRPVEHNQAELQEILDAQRSLIELERRLGADV